MVTRLIILCSFCLALNSCVKSTDPGCTYTDATVAVPAAELTNLRSYVSANRPAAVESPLGFFYEIVAPGTGTVTPVVCSQVTVTYSGKLTNNSVFDENTTGISFILGALIVGWQKGIPLIKKGGSIILYLPPSLGYGSSTVGTIPPNSILIFSIQLLDVQ